MRRSTVLNLPPQLVFPAHSFVNHRDAHQSGLEIQHKNRCFTLIAQNVYKKLLIISQEFFAALPSRAQSQHNQQCTQVFTLRAPYTLVLYLRTRLGAYHSIGVMLQTPLGYAPAQPVNIKLVWNRLEVKNTLAYYKVELIKQFYTAGPQVIKLFTTLI